MTVSVVVPTYNRAHLLPAALDSIKAQSYAVDEIVVVDDGSTDDTAAVVARYGSIVRYVRQENRGVGAARNVGIAHASGRYVAFLDSDDMWLPFKIELQVALLDRLPDVGLLFSEFRVLKDDGSIVSRASRGWLRRPDELPSWYAQRRTLRDLGVSTPDVPDDAVVYTGGIYRPLLDDLPALTSATIVRRDALDVRARFAEGVAIFEDWEFFARVARDRPAAFVDVETVINRGHAGEERVTRATRLARAQCYVSLLDRVWLADPDFRSAHPDALSSAEERGLVAVAREALLASRVDTARGAMARWMGLSRRDRAGWATFIRACAHLPGGALALKAALVGQRMLRVLAGRGHERYSVNPAA